VTRWDTKGQDVKVMQVGPNPHRPFFVLFRYVPDKF
jgi:hypothetical protein